MAIIPIRDLGSVGVISDQSAFLLPQNAMTAARNVRFSGNRVTSGPAWRQFRPTLTIPAPVFAYGTSAADGGFDNVILASHSGEVHLVTPGTDLDISLAGSVQSVADDPWTGCTLSGIHYLNRADRAPMMLTQGATQLVAMANWPSGVLCKALRTYGSRLIALNTTEGGITFPGRIRASEAAQNGAEPVTWDATDDTHTALFNDLAEIRAEILDGLQLGHDFMIYGPLDVYRVTLTAGQEVLDFNSVWNDLGVINTNCVAQVNQQHVVFARDDIVLHNGVDRKSLVDERVRRRIFDNLDLLDTSMFFVVHDKANREVYFCYRSVADDVYWSGTDYCNEAAVWNYSNDTWTFRDLPNVGVAAAANADAGGDTFDSADAAGTTYDETTSSYGAGQGSSARSVVFPGLASSQQPVSTTLILDGYGPDQRLSLPLYTVFQPEAYAERSHIALDNYGTNLRDYKRLRSVYPMILTEEIQVVGQVGSTLYPNQAIKWSGQARLDATRMYKVDHLQGGRYLAYRLRFQGQAYFEFAGIDADIVTKGRR